MRKSLDRIKKDAPVSPKPPLRALAHRCKILLIFSFLEILWFNSIVLHFFS